MSIEGLKQTKLLLIGETGVGKSSLGNFILKSDVFSEGDSNNSVTKDTIGYFGEGDRSDVFVIDTPGLNDTCGFDNEGIQNIIECVKNTGLQGIVLTMNYNVDRFYASLKQVVKVISDIFLFSEFWKHTCIVWTKCYNFIPRKKIEKYKIEKEKFKEEMIEFIKQTNKINENIDIPMFFVDSQPEEDYDNTRTEEEIVKLIKWARGLKPFDKEEINKIINEYKEIIYEEKEGHETIERLKQTKLLLIGETCVGKSSLGNFILKKNVFMVCDGLNSVTKEGAGYFGEGDRSDVFVIDTPGLNDTCGFDNEGIQNIIGCVKVTGLQGIILTMDYNSCRLSGNLKYIVKVISDAFPIKDFWKHVCIVWTKCYNCYSQKKIEKDKILKNEIKEEMIEFIKQTNKINKNIDIPMYYVDSQPDDEDYDNTRSEEEIVKLIKWARGLSSFDKEEINKLIGEFKEIGYEEKEECKIIEETKYNITYKITNI
ncbi:hypothetical protein, conserved [Entamoeba dispar SAW760]|uniref:AIG1-type G domain-containing protein n=1 Tax=Entamoeba dispar (strain ATCC PRA-260 / SAW760) TaxID=370354 RepID=B0EBZ2_ENTDS|nr:uncharacterized protein EDI_295710 [Entamoeba dispar SAW760]EDR27954.1 hypothetical protein, conserved [Entamoeba dispar SAW760]|eukprot:EDR27954.1 hypothetical protein, conserved [Entamoeba dispar SAW760]